MIISCSFLPFLPLLSLVFPRDDSLLSRDDLLALDLCARLIDIRPLALLLLQLLVVDWLFLLGNRAQTDRQSRSRVGLLAAFVSLVRDLRKNSGNEM